MRYDSVASELRQNPKRWVVTGAAGFIGSHLVEELLGFGQHVVAVDNFSTGYEHNIQAAVGDSDRRLFTLVRGDVSDPSTCRTACDGADYVLHQAALGSVPRSIEEPLASHRANVDGFIEMLVAARDAGAKRFVYASSSSVYGDLEESPKVEQHIGEPLSPYAVTKRINELYANNFSDVYGMSVTGLRYFNVFGARQDPNGAYAAVIPRWIDALRNKSETVINGDGETSRDFCYVKNVVQANILSAVSTVTKRSTYNIAVGAATSLNELHRMIRSAMSDLGFDTAGLEPKYGPFRQGDIRHSLADISQVRAELGFEPATRVDEGIRQTVAWFLR
jgi:UDP-N-acetylglucosamine 4-epimerase